MPVDAQINELYAWHGHITKLNGKNTIILMNDRTMYSLVFRNRLPRNVDKFAELIKEAIEKYLTPQDRYITIVFCELSGDKLVTKGTYGLFILTAKEAEKDNGCSVGKDQFSEA